MKDFLYFPGFLLPADAQRWVDRMEAGSQALESMFGIALNHAFSGTKNNVTKKEVPDRRKFFAGRLKTRNRWFSLYSGRMRRAATGVENDDYFNFGGNVYGGEERYKVALALPPQSPATHEQLLARLGDALQAQSAQIDPVGCWQRLRSAHWCSMFKDARAPLDDRTAEESSLPLIRESAYAGLGRLQPHHLGWLNYWSQEACDDVGFPEHAHGLEVLHHSYRTPGGAWIVKLAASPPEAGDARYTRLLAELYERFPRVGIRVSEAPGEEAE